MNFNEKNKNNFQQSWSIPLTQIPMNRQRYDQFRIMSIILSISIRFSMLIFLLFSSWFSFFASLCVSFSIHENAIQILRMRAIKCRNSFCVSNINGRERMTSSSSEITFAIVLRESTTKRHTYVQRCNKKRISFDFIRFTIESISNIFRWFLVVFIEIKEMPSQKKRIYFKMIIRLILWPKEERKAINKFYDLLIYF